MTGPVSLVSGPRKDQGDHRLRDWAFVSIADISYIESR